MSRRAARVTALQVLFQVDLVGADPEQAFANQLENFPLPERSVPFARELLFGAIDKLPELDQIIREKSKDWEFDRLASVDRNILRLGLFEILFRDDIPHNVSINEALEMARTFSTEESVKFINGILGGQVEAGDKETVAETVAEAGTVEAKSEELTEP